MAMDYGIESNIEKLILLTRFTLIHLGTFYVGYLCFPSFINNSILSFIWFGMKILIWMTFIGIVYVWFVELFENIISKYRELRLTVLDRKEYNKTNMKYQLEDSRKYRNTLEKLSSASSNFQRYLYSFQLFCIKNWIPLSTLLIVFLLIFFMILI